MQAKGQRVLRRHRADRRRHVVIAAAVLIVGNNEQRLVPCGPVAQGVIDVVDQLLAQRYVEVGVLAVARGPPAGLSSNDVRK